MDVHLQNPVEDAELTRALADVIGHLRKRQYGEVVELLGDALRGSGEAFLDTLARHLLYEERVLFPSFRTRDFQAAEEVKSLQAEHARLRELARELAGAIKTEDFQRGYDVARTFLAELYDHIGHEARVTDRTTSRAAIAPLEHAEQTRRLDLPGARAESVLSTFDALAPGETLVLRSETALRPHYERLSALRGGLFRWSLLEPEGGKEQALITRLQPTDRETTVGAFFGRDHDEIDLLLEYTRRDLEGAARAGGATPVTLLPYFEEFKRRLERHIRWEEELLFPAVESGEPQLVAGPGRVLRLEHQEIRRLLTCLEKALRLSCSIGRITGSPGEIFEELASVLAAHNMKEEAVYYPLADRRLSSEETGRLLFNVTLRKAP